MADYLDKDHLRAAEKAGCVPVRADETYTIEDVLGRHLYGVYRRIAIRERSSVVAVVRDVLRKNAEGVA